MFKRYKNPFSKDSSEVEEAEAVIATAPHSEPRPFRPVEEPSFPKVSSEVKEPSLPPIRNRPPMTPPTLPTKVLEAGEPETTIGEGVVFKGQLHFDHLLRIDGHFEGELVSKGKLVVGPKGVVKSNLKLREAVIEGEVEGDIVADERVELSSDAKVKGNIETKFLTVDEGARLFGQVHVIAESRSDS